jgi:predicted dehydrogenase
VFLMIRAWTRLRLRLRITGMPPATILACDAGKHVYVEKPCSHNVCEGWLMIEAARKHNRVVQVGTQARNSKHVRRAMQLLREGAIGDVLVAEAWDSQRRRNIGHGRPGKPPAHLDYDLWLGPAPYEPFYANRLHYNWHWRFACGTGDLGNDGIHELDLARWGLTISIRNRLRPAVPNCSLTTIRHPSV